MTNHGSSRLARRVRFASESTAVSVAMQCMSEGRWREADQVLADAWGRAAAVGIACALARVRHKLSGPDAALAWLLQARARFPGSVRLMAQEARLLEWAGRWDAAAQAWARVLERRPDDPRAKVAHLAACVRALPPELGISELRSLLRLPRLAREVALHRQLARLLEAAHRPAEALASWRAAAAHAPADVRLRAELVFALRRCGRHAEAFPGLLALAAAEPQRPPVLAALVADARRLGQVGRARRTLIDLARGNPELGHLWGWVRRLEAPAAARRPGVARR